MRKYVLVLLRLKQFTIISYVSSFFLPLFLFMSFLIQWCGVISGGPLPLVSYDLGQIKHRTIGAYAAIYLSHNQPQMSTYSKHLWLSTLSKSKQMYVICRLADMTVQKPWNECIAYLHSVHIHIAWQRDPQTRGTPFTNFDFLFINDLILY